MTGSKKSKQARYTRFADVGKIFSHAKRLEIMDALIQRERSVENISHIIEQSVASTSQHLQVLKRAQVVQTHRQGTTIVYRLTEGTREVFVSLRAFAEAISPELQLLKQQHEDVPTIAFEQVCAAMKAQYAVLIDVRTVQEYNHNHIEGAINIPLSDIPARIAELSVHKDLIITCRGPYCTSSDEAVRFLLEKGFSVFRYDDGIGEWQAQGGIVSSETAS